MIVKLATLFLCVMALAALILGRRRKKPSAPARRAGQEPRAVRCPDCGAWIVEGARCPCAAPKP